MQDKKLEVRLVCIDEKMLDKDSRAQLHSDGYDTSRAFVLPIIHEEKFRAIVNTLKEFMDMNSKPYLDICDDLHLEVKVLTQSLQYLINSTSWLKGDKYYDFDKFEIDRKLGRK